MLLLSVRVLAVVAVALYLVPGAAHLLELAGKMAMPPADYMIVQRLYDGWALFGIVIFLAMLLVLMHAILRRRHRVVCILSLASLLCLVAGQVVFWRFTYPINVATQNWTVMPVPFEAARRQWEDSHAAGSVLTFIALVALAAALAWDAGERGRGEFRNEQRPRARGRCEDG